MNHTKEITFNPETGVTTIDGIDFETEIEAYAEMIRLNHDEGQALFIDAHALPNYDRLMAQSIKDLYEAK